MLPRLYAWLGPALLVAACGFDSSGNGNAAAEIGESAEPDSSADDDPADDGDSAATTAESSASTTTSAPSTDETTAADEAGSTDEGTTGAIEWGPFDTATPITELNSTWLDDDPTLRGDLLEIYFASDRSGYSEDIWFAVRPSTAASFSPPMPVAGDVNDLYAVETTPELSPNGLVLTFASNRIGGAGQLDLYVTTRNSVAEAWAPVTLLVELASSDQDSGLTRTQDERTGYMCRNGSELQEQLLVTTRARPTDPWGMPEQLSINTAFVECSPWIDPTGAQIWFNSQRDGGEGAQDLWWAAVAASEIAPPEPVEELNTEYSDEDPSLSPSGDLIVFASNRDGTMDLFSAVRAPL